MYLICYYPISLISKLDTNDKSKILPSKSYYYKLSYFREIKFDELILENLFKMDHITSLKKLNKVSIGKYIIILISRTNLKKILVLNYKKL